MFDFLRDVVQRRTSSNVTGENRLAKIGPKDQSKAELIMC